VSQSGPNRELIAEEDRLWTELHDLVDSMRADKVEEPVFYAEGSPEADRWIRKSGPEHYAEHVPRLREWVGEIGR
jgi:hypothetical protein